MSENNSQSTKESTEKQEPPLDIYTEEEINLEDIIWAHARVLHHITYHRKDEESAESDQTSKGTDDFDTEVQKEIAKCELCMSHASAYKVDMSALRITHSKPDYKSLNPKVPATINLFESKYTNRMTIPQKFSFKTKKRTTSVATVKLKNPVFYGSEGCKLAVQVPEEIKQNSPVFGEEIEPSKAQEEFKEELTWTVDNFIECPPLKTTKANLMLEEHRYASKFVVKTMVKGTVTVTVHAETMNKPQHITIDIAKVIRKYNEKASGHQRSRFEVNEEGKVTYTTTGRCKFVYGLEQSLAIETTESKDNCCTII